MWVVFSSVTLLQIKLNYTPVGYTNKISSCLWLSKNWKAEGKKRCWNLCRLHTHTHTLLHPFFSQKKKKSNPCGAVCESRIAWYELNVWPKGQVEQKQSRERESYDCVSRFTHFKFTSYAQDLYSTMCSALVLIRTILEWVAIVTRGEMFLISENRIISFGIS